MWLNCFHSPKRLMYLKLLVLFLKLQASFFFGMYRIFYVHKTGTILETNNEIYTQKIVKKNSLIYP